MLLSDDGALLASIRFGAERSIREYQSVCTGFGLTLSIPKTMHLVTGRETVGSDLSPIKVNGGDINSVDEFGTWAPELQLLEEWMEIWR